MNYLLKPTSVLAGALLTASSLLNAGTVADPVATDPVGYVTVDIPAGLSILSLPMQKSSVYAGEVTAVAGTSVTCSIVTLDAGFYYVQVVSSAGALGKVANVSSVSGGVITVDPAITGLAVSDQIVVRPHFVLSDVYATPEFSDGSTITVYTPAGSKESFEYISSGTLGLPTGLWADSLSEDASNVAILPSEGFVFSNAGAAASVVVTGAVATDPISAELGASFSIVGSNSPTDSVTIATIFADLPIGSTITVYASDGSLSVLNSYEVVDSADLGLGVGKTFVRNGSELGDDDTVPAGSGLVVTPSSGSDFEIPAAYTSN